MQQALLSSVELCLTALEQALASSLAREEATKKQLDLLIIGFKHLEGMLLEQKELSKNVLPPIPTILARRPPPPALPTEFNRERSQGQGFLNSVQMYIHLCPESFHSDQVKITWTVRATARLNLINSSRRS